jgi:hypothetical protein
MKALFETRKAVFLAALFSGVVAQGAHAATLASSYVSGSFGCLITNLDAKAITVKIELVFYDGTVLLGEDRLVPPGGASDVFGAVESGYCRFSGKFSKNKVRANLTRYSGGVSSLVVPAN